MVPIDEALVEVAIRLKAHRLRIPLEKVRMFWQRRVDAGHSRESLMAGPFDGEAARDLLCAIEVCPPADSAPAPSPVQQERKDQQ